MYAEWCHFVVISLGMQAASPLQVWNADDVVDWEQDLVCLFTLRRTVQLCRAARKFAQLCHFVVQLRGTKLALQGPLHCASNAAPMSWQIIVSNKAASLIVLIQIVAVRFASLIHPAARRHGTILVSQKQHLFVQTLLAEVRLPAIVASRMGPHIAKTQIAARVCVQSMCIVAQPSGMFSVCRKFFNFANRFHALAGVAVRRLLVL